MVCSDLSKKTQFFGGGWFKPHTKHFFEFSLFGLALSKLDATPPISQNTLGQLPTYFAKHQLNELDLKGMMSRTTNG
jgi:hypothetical protein